MLEYSRLGTTTVPAGVLEPSGFALAEVSVDMVVSASEVFSSGGEVKQKSCKRHTRSKWEGLNPAAVDLGLQPLV